MSKSTNRPFDHLREHWMAWLVLRHLLPARILRGLAERVVLDVSGGAIALAQLFEEVEPRGALWSECWMIRQHVRRGPLEAYLQRLVCSLVWQNDQGGWPELNVEDVHAKVDPGLVEWVTRVGAADFSWSLETLGPLTKQRAALQPSFASYLDSFAIAHGALRDASPEEFWTTVSEPIAKLAMPLGGVMVKHLADLCADADAWDKALVGYERAASLLDAWRAGPAWRDVAAVWRGVTAQSRASALSIVASVDTGAAPVLDGLRRHALGVAPVVAANSGLDAINVLARGFGALVEDPRVAVMQSPLLHASHDPSAALEAWLAGKHDDAAPRFWAVLRRQVALGASTESRSTKMWYARSLFDAASATSANVGAADSFRMAVRLLVESMHAEAAERIAWNEAVVDANVDLACVELVQSTAGAFDAVRARREVVAVALFRVWAARIDPAKREVILGMWRHLAILARDFDASMDRRLDVGRDSFEALRELASAFGNLRREVAGGVAEAVHAKLAGQGIYWGKSKALEVASAYASAFDDTTLAAIVERALEMLSAEDPWIGRWPFSRPALEFLTSPTVKRHASSRPDTARRIIEQILRFGGNDGTAAAHLLFDLRRFDPSVLADESIRARLRDPLERLRRGAHEINSSAVTGDICALLIAPSVSGVDGIADALEGLEAVLASAGARSPSLGLTVAYDALLVLAENRTAIEAAVGEQTEWLHSKLTSLLKLTVGVWEAAAQRPTILAPFALPPRSKPDRVVVHNWAFASERFAEMLGRIDVAAAALAKASANPELAGPIALAAATRAVARASESVDPSELRLNDREAFYTALGRRLAQLQNGDDASQAAICQVLVEQCIRFGPKEVDAAVLVLAARLKLHQHFRSQRPQEYIRRINDDRVLRLTLGPIVALFSDHADAQDDDDE